MFSVPHSERKIVFIPWEIRLCFGWIWKFIVAFHMQIVDRWLYFRLKLVIIHSLVPTRTNWTNSIDAIYLINANWIHRHYSIVHRIYCISMGCFRCGNLYARNTMFGRGIRYHKTGTEAYVCHDVRSIQRPTGVPFRMCPLKWLHHLMWSQRQPKDFVMLFHCMSLWRIQFQTQLTFNVPALSLTNRNISNIDHIPADVVVDSVVTVIDEFDNKCWLIALIVFVSEDALLPILLNDIDDGFWLGAVLELDIVELFAMLLLKPLLALSLFSPLALLLLRDARLLARADIRRFKSSRRSDFNGDTWKWKIFVSLQ